MHEAMDGLPLRAVGRRQKVDSATFRSGARRAADAMDVVFRALRQIKIDDMLDVRNVKAARGNIGGNQNTITLVAEVLDHAFTATLL